MNKNRLFLIMELTCVICGKKVKINKYKGTEPYTCAKCRPPKEEKK